MSLSAKLDESYLHWQACGSFSVASILQANLAAAVAESGSVQGAETESPLSSDSDNSWIHVPAQEAPESLPAI